MSLPTVFSTTARLDEIKANQKQILTSLTLLLGKVDTLMSTINTASSVLAQIPTLVGNNTAVLQQLQTGINALQTEDAKVLGDFEALVTALQTGQPSQAQIDTANSALQTLQTNNGTYGQLVTLIQQITQASTTADPGTPPAVPPPNTPSGS